MIVLGHEFDSKNWNFGQKWWSLGVKLDKIVIETHMLWLQDFDFPAKYKTI